MITAAKLLGKLPPSRGRVDLLKEFHNTNNIITAVIEQHDQNRAAGANLAPSFDRGNDYDTMRALWEFEYYNLNYKAEGDTQKVKSIQAILRDAAGRTGNDCKHYSGFAASILDALDIPGVYRFACYDTSGIPSHVYIVSEAEGDKIILDGTLPYFNSEKKYVSKIDIKFNTKKKKIAMPLYRVTGAPGIGYTPYQKAQHEVLKYSMFTNRGAFELLVKFNIFGLANKLKTAIGKNETRVSDFWYNWGGDFNNLKSVINSGATKNRILGTEMYSTSLSPDYRPRPARLGSVTAAGVISALVAATPIIIACLNVLKALNVDTSDMPQSGFAASASGLNQYDFNGDVITPLNNNTNNNGGNYNQNNNSGSGAYPPGTTPPKTILGIDQNTFLIGAALGAFLLFKD